MGPELLAKINQRLVARFRRLSGNTGSRVFRPQETAASWRSFGRAASWSGEPKGKDDAAKGKRFGRPGKQTVNDTGPLNPKRMTTIDDELLARAVLVHGAANGFCSASHHTFELTRPVWPEDRPRSLSFAQHQIDDLWDVVHLCQFAVRAARRR